MSRSRACAKINLALVVGPLRPDSRHEVVTLLQRVDLCDDVEVERSEELRVEGFPEDTLVRSSLGLLSDEVNVSAGWRARIEKRIPVAAGLGGGSADAAAALALANSLLPDPVSRERLLALAARIGADVPFFLCEGPQLATGDGTELAAAALPRDYVVVLLLPHGEEKKSTEAVYGGFDERAGAEGFDARRRALLSGLTRVRQARDLGGLPRNDLASSPLTAELEHLGAFRADVTGAGPAIYGLFEQQVDGERAAEALRGAGRTWLVRPVD